MKSLYVGIAVFALGFTAGAAINGWRLNTKLVKLENTQLRQQVSDSNTAFNNVNTKLKDVLLKVDTANTKANTTLVQLDTLGKATNTQLGTIASNAQKVNNEISALEPPTCVFGAKLGGLYLKASEAANSGRNALYGPEARNSP